VHADQSTVTNASHAQARQGSGSALAKGTRRTKIVCSYEGRMLDPGMAARLLEDDADSLRLVYNRDAGDRLAAFIKAFRAGATSDRKRPSLMIDLAEGARGMIHNLEGPRELNYGDVVTLGPIGSKETFQVNTKNWGVLFRAGATVFVGYGNVVLRTLETSTTKTTLEVLQGGTVFPETDLHVPDTRSKPNLSELNIQEIRTFLASGVDHLVLPGVVDPSEVSRFRAELAALKPAIPSIPWLILRVDSLAVYEELDRLLPAVDGVLISRREMALSFNPATIPMITKEIIQRCNDQAKLALTASEMLGSMRRNVTPTRAEVSDIANSVIDGTDGVVISEEVAHGKYAEQALQVMRRIIGDVEARTFEQPNWTKKAPTIVNEFDAISFAAYRTAERVNAKAIVCLTKAGNTAIRLASFRAPVPIVAVTFSPEVLRRLTLVSGVEGIVLDIDPKIDEVLPVVNERLLRDSWLKAGDRIVFVSISLSSMGRESSNLVTVQQLS